MFFLISLALAILMLRFCSKSLREHSAPYYIGAAILAIAVVICTRTGVQFPVFINQWIWPIFSRSAFSTALFALIMWAGAFPNGSAPIRTLMPVRGELSILACILTLGHNAAYGMTYFRMLFTRPEWLPVNQLAAAVCSLVMIIIMLPLFVTSFKCVRRKMDGRSWKRLQRFAYGFYALLYIHVLLLTLPAAMMGQISYIINLLVYSVVFLGYAFCRVLKYLAMKKKDTAALPSRQKKAAVAALVFSLCLTVGACAYGVGEDEGTAQPPETETIQVTEAISPETTPPAESTAPLEETAPVEEAAPVETAHQETNKPAQESPVQSQSVAPPSPVTSAPPAASTPPELVTSTQPAVSPAPSATPEPVPEPEPEPVRVYRNGTFTGSGNGFTGPITVSVTIQDDVITAISIVSATEDEPYFSNAKGVISKILSAQSVGVDTVSGATFSSKGIINGVKAALASAKIDHKE